MYHFVFLGAPGIGKSTQAKIFAGNHNFAPIIPGELLHSEIAGGTKLGAELKHIVESGELVPIEFVIRLMDKKLEEAGQKNGYIWDGFPRAISTVQIASEFFAERHFNLTAAILFDVSDANLSARFENRRCSEGRFDDTPEVWSRRLKVYQEKTFPVVDFYEKKGLLVTIDGNGSIEEVQANLVAAISVLPAIVS